MRCTVRSTALGCHLPHQVRAWKADEAACLSRPHTTCALSASRPPCHSHPSRSLQANSGRGWNWTLRHKGQYAYKHSVHIPVPQPVHVLFRQRLLPSVQCTLQPQLRHWVCTAGEGQLDGHS